MVTARAGSDGALKPKLLAEGAGSGFGFMVYGLGSRAQSSGFRVQGSWFRVLSSWFRV